MPDARPCGYGGVLDLPGLTMGTLPAEHGARQRPRGRRDMVNAGRLRPIRERPAPFGSFTSSSSYKPMLFLSLSGLAFDFRTVNLKNGVQRSPEYLAV